VIKLVCPECQHDNEPERIYCHDCGARLDRSAIASRVSPKEGLKETRRRVRNLFDPKGLKIRLQFYWFCKFILGAFVLAAVVQMILPPDIAPPAKSSPGISQMSLELENAITYHRPQQLQYTDDQVNDQLRYMLKNKLSLLNKPFLEFRRAVVEFGEGVITVTVERSISGFSVYTSSSYAVRVGEGKPVVSSKGGRIGRLPVHPAIMEFGDIIFADLWTALEREHKLVSKMGAIEFHPKNVILTAPVPMQ